MGRLISVRLTVVLLCWGIASSLTPPAAASHGWQGYSIAYESTNGPFYGAEVTRPDQSVGCSGVGHPIFRPLWVRNSAGWIEVGTGHCVRTGGGSTEAYWYWGYNSGSGWQWVGTRTATPGQTHRFELFRHSPCRWQFTVDTTVIAWGIVNWCTGGSRVDAGLESYSEQASVWPFNSSSLRVFDATPWAWRYFNGYQSNSPQYPMCGRYMNVNTWRASEGWSC